VYSKRREAPLAPQGWSALTQRSWFPARLMEDPLGKAAPLYVQGPVRLGAVCTAILPPVEKRKYVPSGRRMMEGS
jgi:hypothetical protein